MYAFKPFKEQFDTQTKQNKNSNKTDRNNYSYFINKIKEGDYNFSENDTIVNFQESLELYIDLQKEKTNIIFR